MPEQRVEVRRHRDDPVAQRVGPVAGAVPVGHGDGVADGEPEAVRGLGRPPRPPCSPAAPPGSPCRAGRCGTGRAPGRTTSVQRRVGAVEEAQLGAGGQAGVAGPHGDGPLGRRHRPDGGVAGLLDDQRELEAVGAPAWSLASSLTEPLRHTGRGRARDRGGQPVAAQGLGVVREAEAHRVDRPARQRVDERPVRGDARRPPVELRARRPPPVAHLQPVFADADHEPVGDDLHAGAVLGAEHATPC